MTKKEYKKITHEISAHVFPHTYKALDTVHPHEESINVVEFEKITEILNKHVKKRGKRKEYFHSKKKARKKHDSR